MNHGKIFVIAGPSGVGKTNIIKRFLALHPDFVYSVSATTRKQRPLEVDGVDYYFISETEFAEKIDSGEFLEWEKVYDYFYGTLKHIVLSIIENEKHIIIEVDVRGALSVKNAFPAAVMIFIEPPGFPELEKRLRNRKTETQDDLVKRLERAKMELEQKDQFDISILNNDLETAIKELDNFIVNKIKR